MNEAAVFKETKSEPKDFRFRKWKWCVVFLIWEGKEIKQKLFGLALKNWPTSWELAILKEMNDVESELSPRWENDPVIPKLQQGFGSGVQWNRVLASNCASEQEVIRDHIEMRCEAAHVR